MDVRAPLEEEPLVLGGHPSYDLPPELKWLPGKGPYLGSTGTWPSVMGNLMGHLG